MPFTYTQVADYAVEDFVTFQLVNTLIESTRYIAEDFLGVAHGDTDGFVNTIPMDNGATHGGAIYFNGGTSKFLKCDAAGTYLELSGMNLVMPSTTLIEGERVVLSFFELAAADEYATTGVAGTAGGYYAPKAGSIISVSLTVGNVSAASFTVQGEVHKNGSSVLNSSALVFTGEEVLSTSITQARGTDTFVATDLIDVLLNFTAGGSTAFYFATVELLLDT